MPDCSISIVNYNTRDMVVQCIESVYAHTKGISFDVTLVDNASTDGSVEAVRKKFPQVQVIANPENLYFTKACNQGMKASKSRYALCLNPDCYIVDDVFTTLVKYMDSNPKIGACGPSFFNPDGTLQSLGQRFPRFLFGLFQLTFINTIFPNNPIRRGRNYYEDRFQEIDAMGGGGILVKKEVFETAGYLDEGYVMYYEDVDWCRRIRAAGWPIMHVPGTKIFHYARFDVAVFQKYLQTQTNPVWCTKIASKLVRTYTDKHGLKDLVKELLDVDMSKQQQSSDWGAAKLSDAQLS